MSDKFFVDKNILIYAYVLLSEDFNHGQIMLGLTIRNPFLDQ